MLLALKHLPQHTVEDVLCRALDAFLPNIHDIQLGELEHQAIAEVRASGTHELDDAAVARRLGDELADLALPPELEAATRERLGHSGELSLGQYQVRCAEPWDSSPGVEEFQAIEAFARAGRRQHINFGSDFDPNQSQFQAATLLAMQVEEPSRHWLLLLATVRGDVAVINRALRIFPDLVPLPPAASPQTMLKKFLERYGVVFRLGSDRTKRTLGWMEVVPTNGPPDTAAILKLVHYDPSFPFNALVLSQNSLLGVTKMFVVFGVLTRSYEAALTRKGFHVTA